MRASAPTQRTGFGVVSCSYGGRERALEHRAVYIIYTRARVFSPLGKILSLGPFSDKGKKRGGAAWKTGRTRSGEENGG